MCRSEMLALQRDCITMYEEQNEDGHLGRVAIIRGLKRKERRRNLPITPAMHEAITDLLARSHCEYLFTALSDPARPLSPFTLEDQLGRTRRLLKLHADAGLHTLRHTCLTELALTTDTFTLQRIAGHARVTTTQRYVHVQQEAIELAFAKRDKKSADRAAVPTKSPTVDTVSKRNAVYN